jgi:hypothetical protein
VGGVWSNYVYAGTLTAKGRTYHGLFAMKPDGYRETYVVSTTGEVFVLEDSGQVRLLRRGSRW